jgi:hypothetical protein
MLIRWGRIHSSLTWIGMTKKETLVDITVRTLLSRIRHAGRGGSLPTAANGRKIKSLVR